MHWLAEKQQLLILPFKEEKFLFTYLSRIFSFFKKKWDLHIIQAEHAILSIVGATGMSEGVFLFFFKCCQLSENPLMLFRKLLSQIIM